MRLVTLASAPLTLAAAMLGDPRAQLPWWERQPLRIVHVVTSHDRIDALAPAELAAWKAAQLYNVEHLEVMGMGRKGRAVYSSGDIGAAIAEFHTPEFLRLVENAVSQLSPPAVLLDNVPSSVEVVLRSQDEGRRLLLHLVNFTGEMTRPIRRVVPVSNASVTLADDRPVVRVRTLVSRRELAVGKDSRGRPRFDLPSFEEYEVAVIER